MNADVVSAGSKSEAGRTATGWLEQGGGPKVGTRFEPTLGSGRPRGGRFLAPQPRRPG